MTASLKKRLQLALIASPVLIGLLTGPIWAQTAASPGTKERVANRYASGANAKQSAGTPMPTASELDAKIGKIPLPDFVKTQQAGQSQSTPPEMGPGVQGQSFDMEQSVQRSLDANPQMRSVRAAFSGTEQARRQALANFFPVGTVSYTFTRTDSTIINPTTVSTGLFTSKIERPWQGYWQNFYELQLKVSQPIFTGFKLLSTYQKAALNKEYASANITYTELSMVKAVQQAFLTLLQARANVQSNKDSVARLESQFKVAQAYYDVGLKPRLDVLQAESDLAAAEQTLLKAQNDVLVQTAQLNALLNLPLNQQTNYVGELTYLPFSMSIEQCMDTAYKQRPDLVMAIKSVQMAEKDVKIAAATLYPQIYAQGTHSIEGNTPNLYVRDKSGATTPESTTISISATLQAWDWGSTYFGIQSARDTVKKLQADLAQQRLDVGYQVKNYYLNLQDAAKRISVARTAVEAAKEGFRQAEARYQAQVGTSTDVLTAQSSLSTAETNLTQALTDYQSALADLYVSMGMKNLKLASN